MRLALGVPSLADAQPEEEAVTKLCPNCESSAHARCCSWCGKIHRPARIDHECCSARCEKAAERANKLSDAMERS